MPLLNEHLQKLDTNYFFSDIEKKIKSLKRPPLDLGIGKTSMPIASCIAKAICTATNELKDIKTYKSYGPIQGYLFLRESIVKNDYQNLNISTDEIFISNGTKYTSANIGDLFSSANVVGICDPSYPVYVDSNKMGGKKIIFLPLLEENNFEPQVPNEHVDLIYLCSPNNPTGIALSKTTLKKFINYAKVHNALIIFDGTYEAFITSKDIPHSIYEIDGAKDVAIEMRSFSKSAGFASLRLSYMVIPKNIKINNLCINALWNRYISTKLGNLSYPVQKGAEAIYSEGGKKEVGESIKQYLNNTKILKDGLKSLGYTIFGGIDSPYIWCKVDNMLSKDFFDHLLSNANIVCIPGFGFGTYGEGYVRFSGFADKITIKNAIKNLRQL